MYCLLPYILLTSLHFTYFTHLTVEYNSVQHCSTSSHTAARHSLAAVNYNVCNIGEKEQAILYGNDYDRKRCKYMYLKLKAFIFILLLISFSNKLFWHTNFSFFQH